MEGCCFLSVDIKEGCDKCIKQDISMLINSITLGITSLKDFCCNFQRNKDQNN